MQNQRNPVRRGNDNSGGAVFCIVLVFLVIILVGVLVGAAGLHRVPEGHVGVYWFGGALSDSTTPPGFHWSLPLLTQ